MLVEAQGGPVAVAGEVGAVAARVDGGGGARNRGEAVGEEEGEAMVGGEGMRGHLALPAVHSKVRHFVVIC